MIRERAIREAARRCIDAIATSTVGDEIRVACKDIETGEDLATYVAELSAHAERLGVAAEMSLVLTRLPLLANQYR